MATAPIMDDAQIASNSIVVIVAQNPAIVLVDQAKRDDLFAHIEREVAAFEPDLSTNKGREAIKSFAFKITRTKTAIDEAGKKLNEEARAKIGVVDAARRDAREKLDAMAKSVRAPLTEWEGAEKARVEWCRQVIADLKAGAVVTLDDTADAVRARGAAAWQVVLKDEAFGDMLAEAQAAKDSTVATLRTALARLTREEDERAELQRLRDEAAARAEADRVAAQETARIEAERIATERAAQEAAERAQAEQKRRVAAEKAEAERIERDKVEAVERAHRDADAAAQADRERIQRKHDEQIAAERAKAEQAAQEARAERDRLAAQEANRQAALRREQEEAEQRAADQEHRDKLKAVAKDAIIAIGIPEAKAIKLVQAIVAGDIPNVSMRF